MQRTKTKGRPRQDNTLKQVDDQPGRRIKFAEKNKAALLRSRNYQLFDQDIDSIDISQTMYGSIPRNNTIWMKMESHQGFKRSFQNYETQEDSAHETQVIKPNQVKMQTKLNKEQSRIQENVQANATHGLIDGFCQEPNAAPRKQQESYKNLNHSQIQPLKVNIMHHRLHYSTRFLNNLAADFATFKCTITKQETKILSSKYELVQACLLELYREWQVDPTLSKYHTKSKKKIHRNLNPQKKSIPEIINMLKQNPYLTPKEIREKMKKLYPERHYFTSTIIHQLKKLGFKKRYILRQPCSKPSESQNVQRKQFMAAFQKCEQSKGSRFFYLGEYFLHKQLYADSYWTSDGKELSPPNNNDLVSQGFTIIAFLTSDGNLLWQARMGDYQSAAYKKLISKMMKKYCKKPHDVVILNESKVRDFQAAKEIAKNYNCSVLKLPLHSSFISPLHYFFEDLREKMRDCLSGEGETVLDELQKVVKAMNKLNFIEKSKEQIGLIEE